MAVHGAPVKSGPFAYRLERYRLMKTLICCTLLGVSILGHTARADEITCRDFRHNQDGSWSPLKPIMIKGPQGSVEMGPGTSFREGVVFMGYDIAKDLDQKCQ
jgi:hypothetical protein